MKNEFKVNAYPDEIATRLLKLTERNEAKHEELENTLYNLLAAAQNEYNRDGYRILYDCLAALATGKFEFCATYYDKGKNGKEHRNFFQGDTPSEAEAERMQFTNNFDCSKYAYLGFHSFNFLILDREENEE